MNGSPDLVIFCGPMWGSKTSRLIASIERLKLQGRTVIVYKPSMDARYEQAQICTHSGAKWPATCVSSGAALLNHFRSIKGDVDAVAIDEAFMIDGVAPAALEIMRGGVDVLVATLDLSAKCRTFDEVTSMLPFATRIEKCPAVCPVCGNDAYYTAKLTNDDKEIEVGGKNLYEPRCFRHHPVMCNPNETVG
jgi:thymidine kinase